MARPFCTITGRLFATYPHPKFGAKRPAYILRITHLRPLVTRQGAFLTRRLTSLRHCRHQSGGRGRGTMQSTSGSTPSQIKQTQFDMFEGINEATLGTPQALPGGPRKSLPNPRDRSPEGPRLRDLSRGKAFSDLPSGGGPHRGPPGVMPTSSTIILCGVF